MSVAVYPETTGLMGRGARIGLTLLAGFGCLAGFVFMVPLDDIGVFGYVRGHLDASSAFRAGDYYVLDASRVPSRQITLAPSARLNASSCWTSSPGWLVDMLKERESEVFDVAARLRELHPSMAILAFPYGIEEPKHAYVECEADDGAPYRFVMAAAAPRTINTYYVKGFNDRMLDKIAARYPSSRGER